MYNKTETSRSAQPVERSKQQRRGIKTRERILQVTQELLGKHDYSSVTLDQISAAAGVAKSSLLWHFQSKELLLSEAVCELFLTLENAIVIEKDDSLSGNQRLEILIEKVAEYYQHNPNIKGVLIGLIFNSQLPDYVQQEIDRHWRHHIRALIDYFSTNDREFPESAAHAIFNLIHGSYIYWYMKQNELGYREKLESVFQYLHIDGFIQANQ